MDQSDVTAEPVTRIPVIPVAHAIESDQDTPFDKNTNGVLQPVIEQQPDPNPVITAARQAIEADIGPRPPASGTGQDAWDAYWRREAPPRMRRYATTGIPTTHERPTTGPRTILDLPVGNTLRQLIPPFLAASGVTIIFGLGGVGKGLLALWLGLQLVRLGKRLLIVDYEDHQDEWKQRAMAMDYTDEEMANLVYVNPHTDEWTAPSGPLSEVADYLRKTCDDEKIDYVILDSYVTAASSSVELGGQVAAEEFFGGQKVIGRPMLVLAHVKADGEKWPDKPFGSVHVHNLARETWAVARINDETYDAYDPVVTPHLPRVMSLELHQKKGNNGPRSKPQFVDFNFHQNNDITVTAIEPVGKGLADQAYAIVRDAGEQMVTAAIAKRISDLTGQRVRADNVLRAIQKDKKYDFIEMTKTPYKWGLAEWASRTA